VDIGTAALTLLHILIFVYWLGGDLGAFVASGILSDARQSPAARGAAGRVLADVDMAPRTALILALPTGLALAAAKGWLALAPGIVLAIVALGLGWLALAWGIHLKHAASASAMRRIDLALRWIAAAGLLCLPWALGWPLFLALKAGALAGCILLGLAIRAALGPFGPAFGAMMAKGATPETDAAITAALDRARPMVMGIWALLLCAAFLGVATPLSFGASHG
jgi:hypothetical protein